MTKKLYEESNISAIADAIRIKGGGSSRYTVGQMPNAILAIPSEADLEQLTVNQNGTYLPSSGKDGFSSVSVSVSNSYSASDEGKVVSNGMLKTQTDTTVDENGIVDTTEIKQVTVNVPSSGGSATLVSKNISSNGVYNALIDDEVDGYSEVTVNVPSSGQEAIVQPKYQALSYVYVNTNGTELYRDVNKNHFLNIFETEKNHVYCLCLGTAVGARRRASLVENMTFEELAPYLNSQPQSAVKIYSDGKHLAPFKSGTDDSGNALAVRIIFISNGGLVIYATDNAGREVPAICFDLGTVQEKRIEYIEASANNNQYFNTGVLMTSTTFYEVDICQVSAPIGDNFFIGSLAAQYNEIAASQSSYTVYVNNTSYLLTHSKDRHKIKIYDGELLFDDTKIADITIRPSTANMLLFSRGNAQNKPQGYASNIRIYGLKIWDGETLIHDFHPVKFYNNLYFSCALYDLVTETYVYSLGSSGLLPGPNLN